MLLFVRFAVEFQVQKNHKQIAFVPVNFNLMGGPRLLKGVKRFFSSSAL